MSGAKVSRQVCRWCDDEALSIGDLCDRHAFPQNRPPVIMVERGETFHRGQLRPFRNDYVCVGPDGVRFTNTSKSELTTALRRAYGRSVVLTFVDGPTWRRGAR